MAFGYGSTADPLRVRTEALPAAVAGGVIQEARLSSRTTGAGPTLHCLSLCVVPAADRSLEIALPPRSSLDRVRVDGQAVTPNRRGDRLAIPLPAPGASRAPLDVTIDYDAPASSGKIEADRPIFSMPCLGFSWEIDAPTSWELEAGQAGVRVADFADPAGDSPRLPGPWGWFVAGRDDRSATAIRELGLRARQFRPEGRNLGNWLRGLDAGSIPLVIDRLALCSAGIGPRSALNLPREEASRDVFEIFASLGLVAQPIEGAILITTGWISDRSGPAIRAAIARGSDANDRFQSVARWRGEPSPAPRASSSPDDSPRRFVASSWPESGPVVGLVDRPSRKVRAGGLGLALVLAGVAARRVSPRKRAIMIALILAPVCFHLTFMNPSSNPIPQAIAWASLAVVAFWFGLAIPSPSRRLARIRPAVSTISRWGGSGAAIFLLLPSLPANAPASDATIIAVFPYEPPLDLEKPGEVILRLADFDRLRAMADAPPIRPEVAAGAISAEHVAERRGPRDVRITSTFELQSEGDEPSSWSFPIEGVRGLSANLDGLDVPVRIEAGARNASIVLPRKGRHRLIVRGAIERSRIDGEDALRWAVPPIPATRLVCLAMAPGERIAVPAARGRMELRDGRFEGLLGPVSEVEVRWHSANEAGPGPPRGEVQSLALWDVEPAGDRVRMRLTATAPEGLSRLSLKLEPGVIVRSDAFRGGADAAIRPLADGTTWEASFVPPLEAGETVSLDLWKPLADPKAPVRIMPRVEPLNMLKFEATVGVRRPEDWAGRVAAGPGQEVMADEVFVREWGSLPAGAKTFAGAVQSKKWAEVSLATGPPEERPIVSPRVQIGLSPGRLDVRAEARWVEPAGRSRQVEVGIPTDLRITHVEADGLTDWTRPSDERLRLRFDGPSPPASRKAVIEGWVPIDNDPMAPGPARGEVDVPWPSWHNMTANPGDLQIQAPANVVFHLQVQEGVVALPPRGLYRVPPLASPGRLTWTVEPIGVSVLVQGRLTILPDSAEWVASARYRIPWGPCPPVQLLVPPDWADTAQVELVGSRARPDVEKTPRGTVWTFLPPDPPIWGSLQVIVRAARPWPRRRSARVPRPRPAPPEARRSRRFLRRLRRRLGPRARLREIDRAPAGRGPAVERRRTAPRRRLESRRLPRPPERLVAEIPQAAAAGRHARRDGGAHGRDGRPHLRGGRGRLDPGPSRVRPGGRAPRRSCR